MIMGCGKATTDAELITEYRQFVTTSRPLQAEPSLRALLAAPAALCKHIGKPIREWTDEDIEGVFANKSKRTAYFYRPFFTFLLFRGYRRATFSLMEALHVTLSEHWTTFVAPYRLKVEQAERDLGYADPTKAGGHVGTLVSVLLLLLIWAGKELEEITRADFEAFAEAYQRWYLRTKSPSGHIDSRVARIERYLVHWGLIPPKRRVFRHEEYLAQVHSPPTREAILRYMKWCEAKYEPSTVDNHRIAVFTFFHWLQNQYPEVDRLEEISRDVALSYGHYLKEQKEAGRYGEHYCQNLHSRVRFFFDFLIEERLATSLTRNPFSRRDLPKRPDMLPRYLTDQELRTILSYCEREASLFERTLVITLLHTGIRAMEFAHLKTSDIVQIGGVWKLHIHQGKGLKDRMIPLTSQCLAVLQAWKKEGWEHMTDYLFTRHGVHWRTSGTVSARVRELGNRLGVQGLSAHRFRHSFAVALLNYGIRESALQKLMGHADVGMTLEYARILDETVERSFTEAVSQMEEGPTSWVPNFFVQEDYTLFAEGDSMSWIQLPVGFCRRNPKLHCESDVKCFLCERFCATPKDLPRLQQMYERFTRLGLKLKAEVVSAQIQQLQALPEPGIPVLIPTNAIAVAPKRA
jgi:site-specific recombinase XerD